MRIVILTGLSGSGKSVALHMLEDLDFYCVDNLPVGLLPQFISHVVRVPTSQFQLTAIGIDARNHSDDISDIPRQVMELKRSGVDCEVIYLQAEDAVLLKRYSETRRKHPLSTPERGLADAIREERRLLDPLAVAANLIIDTSHCNVHELRETIRLRVGRPQAAHISIMFESFSFRLGLPGDADFVFDVRNLPNPHWEPALTRLTGLDQPVIDYLNGHAAVQRMLEDLKRFLETWIPDYARSNRSYLTIAIGCTGGQHRSVYFAEQLATHFRGRYPAVLTRHQLAQLRGIPIN